MEEISFTSFADELSKIAVSRFAKYIRSAPTEGAADAIKRKAYSMGADPPTAAKHIEYLDDKAKEKAIKNLRIMDKTDVPEVAPKFSKEWRQAMNDIKHGRMVPHETGHPSKEIAESMKRHGGTGSSPNLSPWPADKKPVQDWYDKRQALEREIPLEASAKLRGGVWASNKDNPTTRTYAKRTGEAAVYEGAPASPSKLTFDIPESLSGLGEYKMHGMTRKADRAFVPNAVFNQWARNKKVVPVE